jgi:hypothetical protein
MNEGDLVIGFFKEKLSILFDSTIGKIIKYLKEKKELKKRENRNFLS